MYLKRSAKRKGAGSILPPSPSFLSLSPSLYHIRARIVTLNYAILQLVS